MESKKHKYLKQIAQIKLHYMGYKVIYPESYAGYVNGHLDAVGARLVGYPQKAETTGIEVKVSRADFFGEKQKFVGERGNRFEEKELGVNYRYFLTPPNLIDKSELYNGWGLMTFNGKRVRVVVEAPRKEVDNTVVLFYLADVAHYLYHREVTGLVDGYNFVTYKDLEIENNLMEERWEEVKDDSKNN